MNIEYILPDQSTKLATKEEHSYIPPGNCSANLASCREKGILKLILVIFCISWKLAIGSINDIYETLTRFLSIKLCKWRQRRNIHTFPLVIAQPILHPVERYLVIQQENKRKAFFMFVFSSWPNVHYFITVTDKLYIRCTSRPDRDSNSQHQWW
jgi:hypothetical protein